MEVSEAFEENWQTAFQSVCTILQSHGSIREF